MDIQQTVINLIAEQLNLKVENIKLEDEFIKDLKADSLDVVELVMSVEEKFDIQIPDEEAEKIQTVKQFINYIQKQKN